MDIIKLGIIRETKLPSDKRVPFSPDQLKEIEETYPHVKIIVQKSPFRSFRDEEYETAGLTLASDVTDCDILMGVKEVNIPDLIPEKTYFFFSHTTKKQPYNKNLLLDILNKKITLIDYEMLTDKSGGRLVAFGRYAGIVGAYNGLLTYGKRYQLYALRRAAECLDLEALKKELSKVKLPPIKIVVTGSGRVGQGAMEILDEVGIRKVSTKDVLNNTYTEPVYVSLQCSDYCEDKQSGGFETSAFYKHPENYISKFKPYTKVTDLLIAGAYWDSRAPVLFTKNDMKEADFKIRVIADITCDIEGSIPSTKKPTTIEDPIYDYDPVSDQIKAPLSSPHYITVMAIDNLPCELPRSSSEDFGRGLVDHVVPSLVGIDKEDIIQRATIATAGKLTEKFSYLSDYVYEKAV